MGLFCIWATKTKGENVTKVKCFFPKCIYKKRGERSERSDTKNKL